MDYFIGVDGGGTHCSVRVVDSLSQELAIVRGGPANIVTDMSKSVENVMRAIERAWTLAGCSASSLNEAVTVLGLAGANIGDYAHRCRQHLPFTKCLVTDDRTTSIAGALKNTDGCAAVIGTGSFFCRRLNGEMQSIGGWGLQLGDDASAARLGQDLLRRVVHCHDGLYHHSQLTEAVLHQFGSIDAMVVASRNASPGYYARFARSVAEAVEKQDEHALDLMRQAAEALMRSLDAVGFDTTLPLVLLGGFGRCYGKFLAQPYADSLREPEGNAIDGAIFLACTMST